MGFNPLPRTGWIATSTHDNGSSYLASNVLDGSLTTYWWSGSTVPQSVMIDMGSAQTFSGVALQAASSFSGDLPTAVTINGSSNGSTWTLITSSSWSSTQAQVAIAFTSASYRYIQVTVTASTGGWTQIAEVNVGAVVPDVVTASKISAPIINAGAGAKHQAVKAPVAVSGSGPIIFIRDPVLPPGIVGIGYSQTLITGGGTSPYTLAVTAGSLPTGLSLNSTSGVISGTPSAAGTFSFTVTATDATSLVGSQAFTISIGAPVLVATSANSGYTA